MTYRSKSRTNETLHMHIIYHGGGSSYPRQFKKVRFDGRRLNWQAVWRLTVQNNRSFKG